MGSPSERLAEFLRDPVLHLTAPVAGQLGSITLLAAAVGGVAFEFLGDRLADLRHENRG